MRVLWRFVVIGVFVLAIAPFGGVVEAAPRASADLRMPRYFPETGFWVQGQFREYWETHGGLFVHGYPISGVFEQDGLLRQYFERSVFEYHPDHAGTPYEVLLMRLGAIRTADRMGEEPFRPIPPFDSSEDHVYHPETGHSLSYGFKTFWNRWGGLPNFGHPISREFDERNQPPPAGDGQIHTVQYFERARFEYHPEHRGTDYEVLLGLLGREYLQVRMADGSVPGWAVQRQDPQMPPYDVYAGRQYGPHVGYGFNVFLRWDGDPGSREFNQKTFDMVKQAGFTWIRVPLEWSVIERQPGQYDLLPADRIINHAHENGIKVLGSLVGPSPGWAGANGGIPTDTAAFESTVRFIANRYAGKVQAWAIWNEQNLTQNVGTLDPGRYVNLLKAGYTGIKAGDPGALVLFGGLTPTGVDIPAIGLDDVEYLRRAYAYNNGEVRDYFDVLGAHPGSNNNPPDTMWPRNPGPGGWSDHPSFYFRRVEQLRQVMVENGDAHKQIWLTEFGWTTANQAPGYEYGADVSETQQAQYLRRAFEIARTEWPWMGVMLVWNLNYSVISPPHDEKHPWAVLNADWSPRPSYRALQEMPK